MSQKPANTARIRVPVEFWPALRFAMPAPLESTYDEEVLADAPVLYWPLGEPTDAGTAVDLSGNERHGQYVGRHPHGPALVAGAPGNRRSMATLATSGQVRSAPFDVMSHCSFELWTQPQYQRGWPDEYWTFPNLVRHGEFVSGDVASGFILQPGSGFLQLLGDGGTRVVANAFRLPAPNQRPTEHLVATVQASVSVALYVNGSAHFFDTVAYPVASASCPFAVADAYDGALISHVAVYGYAVESTRVAAHYAAGIRDAPNRGGIGFTPETVRFEGPPQRWHFPATCSPRGTEDWTLFVVCQLSYTNATQILLHCTAAPIASAGFQLAWDINSGFRWSEIGDTGTNAILVWSAAPSARHVLAIAHTGGLRPVAVTYADGVLGTFGFGQTWSVQNTLTLGTYVGPLSVYSGAIEQVYLVGSAMAQADVIKVTAAL